MRNGSGFLSLFYDIYEYTGGAHGNTVRYGDTWDLAGGWPVPFPVKNRKAVLSTITAQAKDREAAQPGTFFPGVEKNVRRYFSPVQYYLAATGIAVFYQLYTIAPYVAGFIDFTVAPD